ncbi:MAG: M3 family oligoendopeptidase [Paenibacillaceae bacterium]|nr:M3 family oligoendopeptidase [Paenibacillaceae bacterium]
MAETLSQTWDLDAIFPGGSSSPAFAAFLARIESDTEKLSSALEQAEPPQSAAAGAATLSPLVALLQDILANIREAESFTGCLAAENQNDKTAVMLGAKVKTLAAAYQSALTRLDRILSLIPDAVWSELMAGDWTDVGFSLDERRTQARLKLPPEQEALVFDLAVDGYHGWSELYDTTVSRIRFPYEENGETKMLSAGQMFNKLDMPDRERRSELFRQWEAKWGEEADFCADALNHLAGFRLALYRRRGWQSPLQEPLAINRMSRETLDVMWQTVERNKHHFVAYLERKAKLLGVNKPAWHDVDAPIGTSRKVYSYDEGAKLIVDQFRRFSPKMADFAEMAFRDRWIEAEDRNGKRPGGFCTSFPVAGQTRIFMTYAGSASNVSTLAHELGHAYHQHVMNDLPPLSQEYAMNVAETASTLAELIVGSAAVEQAQDRDEKLALVEDKIQRAVAFFMNIHARFLFETAFYEERKQGLVGIERLNALMTDAQQRAYLGALDEYHPHFWAAKLHFYITDVPFYNFPYTFGFLFSAGIYARALQDGAAFEDKYAALLRDTGRMPVEELARKHLGADLTQPAFWQSAVDLSIADVQQFLAMTE